MDIEEIKTKVRANEYIYSHHADLERKADDLTLAQVKTPSLPEKYWSSILTPAVVKVV